MKCTFIASMLALITLAAVGQVHKYDPLHRNCKLLKENPAILESGEALRLAVKKVIPRALGDQQNGEARVTIAVDAGGSPHCIAASEASPLTLSCIEAAKGWKFDSYVVNGQEVPFVTRLTFHFTTEKVWVE